MDNFLLFFFLIVIGFALIDHFVIKYSATLDRWGEQILTWVKGKIER
jgi:hypothetical protein